MRWLVCLPLAVAACHQRPPAIDSCADGLGGVWIDEADPTRRYHLVDERGSKPPQLEVFPLWDTTAPDGGKALLPAAPPAPDALTLSPAWLKLRDAEGGVLEGNGEQRRVRGSRRCAVVWPVRVSGCRGDELVLEQRPPSVDEGCQTTLADWVRVTLRRE